MPSERAPRTLRRPISIPPGSLAPGAAQGTTSPGGEVAGAADDRALLTAGVDPDQDEPVGVGVLGHLEDPGGDDAGQVVPDPVDGLDSMPAKVSLSARVGHRDVDVDVLGAARTVGRASKPPLRRW